MSAARSDSHPRGAWAAHARETLERAGYSRGGARDAVIAALDRQDCAASAQAIHRALRSQGRRTGMASVYRALETLHALQLVTRLEVGQGEALFEPQQPSGEHHHHVVCDRCDRIVPFEDPGLERAISRLSQRVEFDVRGHEVVLHGRCPDCRERE